MAVLRSKKKGDVPGRAGWWLGKTWLRSALAFVGRCAGASHTKATRKNVLGPGSSSEATEEGGKEVGPAHDQGEDLTTCRGPAPPPPRALCLQRSCLSALSGPGFPEAPPPGKEQERGQQARDTGGWELAAHQAGLSQVLSHSVLTTAPSGRVPSILRHAQGPS